MSQKLPTFKKYISEELKDKKFREIYEKEGQKLQKISQLKKKIQYTNEPIGDIKIVKNFLPAPNKLVFKDKGVGEIKIGKTIFDKEMENPKFKAMFEEGYAQLDIGEQIAGLRYKGKMSRLRLAKKVKTTRAEIVHYESGECESFNIKTLVRIARAFHKNLKISFT